MPTLLPFAQLLAQEPPVDVLQQVMKWYSNHLKDLKVANFWKDMVDKYTEAEATYSAAATCDLTAMCMLMVGAGVQRVEAMKTGIRKVNGLKAEDTIFEDKKYGDLVYFVRSRQKVGNFKNLLLDWSKQAGNGVVQFKFKAKGDWHTFAVERAQEKKDEPRFIVYQSYQNVYRLEDFLGKGDPKEQQKHMEAVWKDMKEGDQLAYKNDKQAFIQSNLQRISDTAKYLGCGLELDAAGLDKCVISPLVLMLKGALSNKDYVLMTGSPSTAKTVSSDFMAVLMCNTVSPDLFKDNYQELRSSKDLTMYPECT